MCRFLITAGFRRVRWVPMCGVSVSTDLCLQYSIDRKSTRLNSSHSSTSYAVFCLKKKTGGLHACCLAAGLDIKRVLIPPYCGVLSALGMVVAPPVVDAAKTVAHVCTELTDGQIEC